MNHEEVTKHNTAESLWVIVKVSYDRTTSLSSSFSQLSPPSPPPLGPSRPGPLARVVVASANGYDLDRCSLADGTRVRTMYRVKHMT